MTWIKTIDLGEATGDLRAAYDAVGALRGQVANIIKVHSLKPKTMLAHLGLYRELMFGPSELSRDERETIAVAVSVTNHCHY